MDFADALDAFRLLRPPLTDIKVNMLQRRVGHAIGWMVQQEERRLDMEEPAPGCFSSPEVIEEVKEMPLQPVACSWYLLAKLEFQLKAGDAVFKKFAAEVRGTNELTATVGYGHLKLSHAIARSELVTLIPDFLEYSTHLRTYAKQSSNDRPRWSDSYELLSLLFSALIVLVKSGRFHAAPLDRWKRDVTGDSRFDGTVSLWLQFLASLECAETTELLSIVRDESSPLENRAVAAVMASVRTDVDPEDRFYANIILVMTDLNRSWRDVVEENIAELVACQWKNVAVNEKFALKSPNLNAPRILTECDDTGSSGLQKAARVLLAVRDAVATKVRGVELEKLRGLSQPAA